ncbi:hypothetical protein [Allorhizobium terrae]|uniref:Uncharacterized protein n=1 Tax=Allorhizobium terrae TaxID=1848972 RepID=A0A4S3ZSX6_9HYPH|nr:hypothetical protein [Allorhizobium terrae]THF48662.1 hypothetical protein E6C51_14980 [Allorhizobium terrae]
MDLLTTSATSKNINCFKQKWRYFMRKYIEIIVRRLPLKGEKQSSTAHTKGVVFFALAMLLLPICTVYGQVNAPDFHESDWVQKAFDFDSPELNFVSKVPPDAKVATVPMNKAEAGTIGAIKIIGKMNSVEKDQKIETTILGFDLLAPSNAARLCEFEAKLASYTPLNVRVKPDFSEARVFATDGEEENTTGAVFMYCFSRGTKALAISIVANLSKTESQETIRDKVTQAQKHADAFIDNLVFSNGETASLGDNMQQVPVEIGKNSLNLRIPAGWDIPINDFHGALPAELHMIRQQGGKAVGAIWLSVLEQQLEPNIDSLSLPLVREYFDKQSPTKTELKLIGTRDNAQLLDAGVKNKSFLFSATDENGDSDGDIEATFIWHSGRLWILTLWSAWPETADRNLFFSRLPGLTAYDMVKSQITDYVIKH